MKLKKFFLLSLAMLTMFGTLVAQSIGVNEDTFQNAFDGALVVLSTILTYVAKNQIVKSVDDNWIAKFFKNTWVLSGIVFTVVAFVFVKFGFTAANALLAVKFIGSNLLAVIVGSVTNKTDSTK